MGECGGGGYGTHFSLEDSKLLNSRSIEYYCSVHVYTLKDARSPKTRVINDSMIVAYFVLKTTVMTYVQ